MKQVLIKAKIDKGQLATLIKHKGFEREGIDYILEIIGILDHLKIEMLKKLEDK